MSVHPYPVAAVAIDGQTVPVDRVSVSSDSPVDLHLPPSVGNFPGASASINLTLPSPVTSRPEVPWSPTFRAKPGANAAVTIDSASVFVGQVEEADVSLDSGSMSVSLADPLANVDRTFSAPACLNKLAARPGQTQAVPTGANMLHYVGAAAEALGAHYSMRMNTRTDLYVPFLGSAHALVGTVDQVTQRTTGDSPVVPFVEPEWVSMPGGRIGMRNGWTNYTTRARSSSDPTVGSWHLSVEVDPASATGTAYVRVRALGDESGFGLWFTTNDTVQVVTWDTANTRTPGTYVDQSQTLTEIPLVSGGGVPVQRVLLVYNVVTGNLQVRRLWADGVESGAWDVTMGGTKPTLTTADKQVRVNITGRCTFGTTSLMSRATWVSALDNAMFEELPGLRFNLNSSRISRWRIDGHPPIENERATAFITEQVARKRSILHTDDLGRVWLSDPTDWPALPVSHVISDGIVTGDVDLDDLQVQLKRRERFSRVRVNGTTVSGKRQWGPGVPPKQIYAEASSEITLTPDSDPVEIWLEPGEDMFWAEPPYLNFRWAGETASESWHLPDDFARGRGSWWGGFVRNADNDNFYRWAVPGDVIYTVEQVGYSAVKITMAPGPGLLAGQEFVNLPNPESESLRASNPSRMTRHLPTLRGPSTGFLGETTGVSADIPYNVADWGEYSEYVHDGGLAVQIPGIASTLAQNMADSHESDFGEVTIRCALDASVKVGQRVHVKPTSRSDVTLDGVVTGIPSRDVSAGSAPSMTLTLWVLRVDVHSVTYAERRALMAAQAAEDGRGQSYAADRDRNTGLTYAQERELAELSRSENLAPSLTSVDGWRAQGTLTAVTPGGTPALRLLEDAGGGTLYMDPTTNYQVPAGTRVYLSVDVRVTDPIPMRLRIVTYGGATGAANSPTVTQVTTDGWVTYGLLTTIGGDPNGYFRALVWPDVNNHPEGQGFYVRNYQVRTYT